jgi:glycosyltransferase involved in cell wall biosynthesis
LISSFVDGISDYLTKDIGIDCGTTPFSISNALYDFISLPKKEIEYRKKEGIKIAKKYDWNKLSKQYYKVYKNLIK